MAARCSFTSPFLYAPVDGNLGRKLTIGCVQSAMADLTREGELVCAAEVMLSLGSRSRLQRFAVFSFCIQVSER